MPFISINVTGLTESIDNINRVINGLSQMNIESLNESADLFVSTAKQKAHVITGKTRSSIRKVAVFPKEAVIQADYGAKFEENRQGVKDGTPHKFLTDTAESISSKIPDIIKRHYRFQ